MITHCRWSAIPFVPVVKATGSAPAPVVVKDATPPPPPPTLPDPVTKSRQIKLRCLCGVIIRATRGTFKGAACNACRSTFVPAEPLNVGRRASA